MRVFLRPITEKDSNIIVKWRNSEKVKSHCMTKASISEESNLRFYNENVVTGKYKQFIVERIDEEFGLASYPIATVYLKDMDYENHRCELCIFTSDDAEWQNESQAIAIKLLLEKAFVEYGMKKVYSYVFKKYEDEISILTKAGFSFEAVLKDEALGIDGNYEDVVRLCVFLK